MYEVGALSRKTQGRVHDAKTRSVFLHSLLSTSISVRNDEELTRKANSHLGATLLVLE